MTMFSLGNIGACLSSWSGLSAKATSGLHEGVRLSDATASAHSLLMTGNSRNVSQVGGVAHRTIGQSSCRRECEKSKPVYMYILGYK